MNTTLTKQELKEIAEWKDAERPAIAGAGIAMMMMTQYISENFSQADDEEKKLMLKIIKDWGLQNITSPTTSPATLKEE
jgi:hypothetical protein